MSDEFDISPKGPVGPKDVKAWIQELEIQAAQLAKALADLLNQVDSTAHKTAKKRIEREIDRLTNLTGAIKDGLART